MSGPRGTELNQRPSFIQNSLENAKNLVRSPTVQKVTAMSIFGAFAGGITSLYFQDRLTDVVTEGSNFLIDNTSSLLKALSERSPAELLGMTAIIIQIPTSAATLSFVVSTNKKNKNLQNQIEVLRNKQSAIENSLKDAVKDLGEKISEEKEYVLNEILENVDHLKDLLEGLEKKLSSENTGIKKEMASLKEDSDKLSTMIRKLVETIESLNNNDVHFSNLYKKLVADLESLNKEIDSLKNTHNELENRVGENEKKWDGILQVVREEKVSKRN